MMAENSPCEGIMREWFLPPRVGRLVAGCLRVVVGSLCLVMVWL